MKKDVVVIGLCIVVGFTLAGVLGGGLAKSSASSGAVSGSAAGQTVVVSTGKDSINVQASSVRKVTPDVAKITFSITTELDTAEEAQVKNTEDTNKVIETLKQAGVPDNKIKTYNYNMYPRYDYVYTEGKSEQRVLMGYTVRNTLEVSGLEIDKVGSLITDCVQAGINDIDGIDYTCSTYDEVYNEVLGDAIEAARAKAEVIAASSGVKLGNVISVDEGWQDTSYRYVNNMAMKSASYDMAEASMDFGAMAGELEISANVNVSFGIVE